MTLSAECSDVVWIKPRMINGVAHYSERCQAQLTTPESIEYRNRLQLGTGCGNFAKIDFRGAKLCVKHAEKRALKELLDDATE